MDEWSSHNTNPSKIWKSLKKDNPNLDEQFYRLPNGGWDIVRLNQAMTEKNLAIQKKKQQDSMKSSHLKFGEEQRNQLVKDRQQMINKVVMEQRNKSKEEVDFNTFKFGMAMFFLPAIIQLLMILSLASMPLGSAIVFLKNSIPTLVLLNIIMWISVPVMTKALAEQINKLDHRTRNC
jgi:sorbitol-specific phosphotransferase system component IIBC